MPKTEVRGGQIRDATVGRSDVNVATAGEAIVRKIVAGTGITLSSTGADAGTGDVTVNATAAGGMNLDYLGDYAPGTYNDGDIVVGADGIAYMCVVDGTTTPPESWPATSTPGLIPAHATNHNAGGNDPLTAISGAIITSGTVADARLTANVLKHTSGYPGGTTNFLRADGSFAAPAPPFTGGTWTAFTPVITHDGVISSITINTNYGTSYSLIGNTMTISAEWQLTLNGNTSPPVYLHLALPAGYTAKGRHTTPLTWNSMGAGLPLGTGVVQALLNDSKLYMSKDFTGGNTWPSAGPYIIGFTLTLSV